MADAELLRTTVAGSGTVTVRQRPSLLLMKFPLRAADATLELRLAKLKKQCEATAHWLKGLHAVRVEFGEPHFADQAANSAVKMMGAAALMLGKQPAEAASAERRGEVSVVLTAAWDVGSMSAEQTLVLVDRLRFEASTEAGPPEGGEELPPWASPEDNLREMMKQMIQQRSAADAAPQFLFVSRLGEGQWEKAAAEAFSRARQQAERLARAAGMRLGRLCTVHPGGAGPDHARPDKWMERQRCAALLAGSTYDLAENEMVSDDPRPAEFTVSVNVSYYLE